MSAEVAAVTFQCQDPRKVGAFWAEALGLKVAATSDSGSAAILATVPLYFQRAEGGSAAEATGAGTHLDLVTDDLDADATRLRGLGATEVRRDQWHSSRSITFLDVEGNRFDLITR